ncbi:MAG: hypothetical protein ACOZE5_02835 [Verrucomicrobiota bacterium]|jgi:hypothetical protein
MPTPEDDPPRKVYGFKERTFKRDNAPASELPPAPTTKELAMLAGDPVKVGRGGATGANADDPNDVYAALQRNRAQEQTHDLDRVEVREVKSRRKRDFWLLLVGGNLVIAGLVGLLGPNVVTVLFGFGGVIVFSLGLTWIMWQVMDRY